MCSPTCLINLPQDGLRFHSKYKSLPLIDKYIYKQVLSYIEIDLCPDGKNFNNDFFFVVNVC